jgi:hypothetical protein
MERPESSASGPQSVQGDAAVDTIKGVVIISVYFGRSDTPHQFMRKGEPNILRSTLGTA